MMDYNEYIEFGQKGKITESFDISEFYSKSPDLQEVGLSHFFDRRLILAAQIIRDYVKASVKVNSTYRTEKENKSIKGAAHSFHLTGDAVDLDMSSSSLNKISEDIDKKGELYNRLRGIGISGIRVYDGFIHLDVREGTNFARNNPWVFNGKDAYGRLHLWSQKNEGILENLKNVVKVFFYPAHTVGNLNDDGLKGYGISAIKWLLIIIIPLIFISAKK